jgi:glycosyltransferase involved in cell wall biosynthesis
MKVGINLLYLLPGVVGGTETYAAGLLAGFARVARDAEFVVFLNRESAAWPLPDAPCFRRVDCPVSASCRACRYSFEQLRLPALLRRHGVDLVHSLGYVGPLFPPCPAVVTIHDLNYRAFGTTMPLRRRLGLGRFVQWSARRAAAVIAVSEFGRQEVLAAFRLAPDRVVAVHEAPKERSAAPVDAAEVQRRLGIRPPYLVAFGTRSPHKNVPRLLEAFARARREHRLDHRLVLVGPPPDGDLVRQLGLEDSARFTGFLGDREVKGVLSGADLLVCPSLYEGFGLPVLEAMAEGVPVACSGRASLPEVAGDAAVLFDPLSVEDMARQIARVAGDAALRQSLRAGGFENLKRFSWDRAAEETLAVYRQVCGNREGKGKQCPQPA